MTAPIIFEVAPAFDARGLPAVAIGPFGKSAYELAVANGYGGTEEEWLNAGNAAVEALVAAEEWRDQAGGYAVLAGYYANHNSDADIPDAAPGERGAKYWSNLAGDHAATTTTNAETTIEQAELAESRAQVAQDAKEFVLAASTLYASTAAGVAAVAEGAQFGVLTSGIVSVYRKTGGVAVLQYTFPSGAALDSTAPGMGGDLVKTKHTGTGAKDRKMRDRANDTVHVFDYMTDAEIADVQTRAETLDVTDAIQAAIDSNAPNIYAPPGTYICTFVELGEGQTLRGSGMYGGTKFKLKDNTADYYGTAGMFGLTAKTGITHCAFSDFEYDGNTANNRSWGAGSAAWAPTEYDQMYTQGIYFGTVGGRTAPARASLQNLFIHDTVRSNIVWGTTRVIANNLHLKNSDADHLIYESDNTQSIFTGVILEGYARAGLVVLGEGSTLSVVTVRDLALNPTIYDTQHIFGVRVSGAGSAANITGVNIYDLDPDVIAGAATSASLFQLIGSANVSDVTLLATNSAHTIPLVLIQFNQGLGSNRGYNVTGLTAKGLGAKTRLVQVDSYATAVKSIDINKTKLTFANGAPVSGEYLFNLQGSVDRMTVDGLDVMGTMVNQFAVSASGRTCKEIKFRGVYCESINGRVAIFNSRENITFEKCDFQGASVTDLVSASFFDQVFAKEVRTGDKLYSNNGSSTQSGNGSNTSFLIPHGLKSAPAFYQVTPASAAAGAAFYVTANSVNLIVTYAVAPAAASNNLTWIWSASVTRPPVVC